MAARYNGDFQFCADAIGCSQQQGILVSCRTQVKQSGKSAQFGASAGAACFGGQRFDRIDQKVARIDIDTGVFVVVIVDDVLARI